LTKKASLKAEKKPPVATFLLDEGPTNWLPVICVLL